MSKFAKKVFVVIGACIFAVLLGISTGCKDCHHNNTTVNNPPPDVADPPAPEPEPIIICVVENVKVHINIKVNKHSRLCRQDNTDETILAFLENSGYVVDEPGPGKHTYVCENLITHDKIICEVETNE